MKKEERVEVVDVDAIANRPNKSVITNGPDPKINQTGISSQVVQDNLACEADGIATNSSSDPNKHSKLVTPYAHPDTSMSIDPDEPEQSDVPTFPAEDEVMVNGEKTMPEHVGLFLEDEQGVKEDHDMDVKAEDLGTSTDVDLSVFKQEEATQAATSALPEPVRSPTTNMYASLKPRKRPQAERPNDWAPPKKQKRDPR